MGREIAMTSAISGGRQTLQVLEHQGGAVALVQLAERRLNERHGLGALELVDAAGGVLDPRVSAAVETFA